MLRRRALPSPAAGRYARLGATFHGAGPFFPRLRKICAVVTTVRRRSVAMCGNPLIGLGRSAPARGRALRAPVRPERPAARSAPGL
ncbi:hypothetical protein STRTUCAR8_08833 [Streptomyces turgidiscabies Car8]|uniref:Uncharacterized protein n=1 Tax=Streptomyces turgidiscabies (strain Car8) TaxID=698760 RepID=L7F8V2_STRT8|nr:hypothetical protein STRTUCAR8_08833 [Streptomyces turgidiscabies Car8]